MSGNRGRNEHLARRLNPQRTAAPQMGLMDEMIISAELETDQEYQSMIAEATSQLQHSVIIEPPNLSRGDSPLVPILIEFSTDDDSGGSTTDSSDSSAGSTFYWRAPLSYPLYPGQPGKLTVANFQIF